MKKVYVSWTDVQRQVQELMRQMWLDQWTPDYVVGITRGGLVPANLISQYLNCSMETLKVKLRDGKGDNDCESNLWMPEDAVGYVSCDQQDTYDSRWVPSLRKKILIVDDINDTGATLNWIKNDWQSTCLPDEETWNTVWGNNVRVAVLYNNESSESRLDPSYAAETINKFENPQWIVFPWEEWWRRWNPEEQHQ
jgi:xanthine phosphoribosyltransferase